MSTPKEPVKITLNREFALAIIEADDLCYYEGIAPGSTVWPELVKMCERVTGVKAESNC